MSKEEQEKPEYLKVFEESLAETARVYMLERFLRQSTMSADEFCKWLRGQEENIMDLIHMFVVTQITIHDIISGFCLKAPTLRDGIVVLMKADDLEEWEKCIDAANKKANELLKPREDTPRYVKLPIN